MVTDTQLTHADPQLALVAVFKGSLDYGACVHRTLCESGAHFLRDSSGPSLGEGESERNRLVLDGASTPPSAGAQGLLSAIFLLPPPENGLTEARTLDLSGGGRTGLD